MYTNSTYVQIACIKMPMFEGIQGIVVFNQRIFCGKVFFTVNNCVQLHLLDTYEIGKKKKKHLIQYECDKDFHVEIITFSVATITKHPSRMSCYVIHKQQQQEAYSELFWRHI